MFSTAVLRPSRHAALAVLLTAGSAHALDFSWDPANDAAGASGTWNTSGLFWDSGNTAAAANANVAWLNGVTSNASFDGTDGAITLGANITAGALTFNTAGYLIHTGANTLTLNSANSGTAGTIVFNGTGTLALVNDGDGTGSQQDVNFLENVSMAANATLSVGRFTNGVGILNATNKTFLLGDLSIGANVLSVTNNNSYGLRFTGPTSLSGAATFNVGGGSNAPVVQGLTLSGVVAGGFGITKSGGGTLVLGNSGNTFGSGGSIINLSGGLLSVGDDGALGDSGNIVALKGGGLQATATFTTARQINTTAAGGVIDVTEGSLPGSLNLLTVTAPFNGGNASANGLTKNGNGILEINANNNGVTPYTGVITINAGALRVSDADALGAPVNNTLVANTVVANNVGAAVQINSVSTAEPFNISNTGINTGGAIENLAGTNDLTGLITLGAAATIGSSGGTLNILGGIATGTNALTFAGTGDIVIGNMPITGSTGSTVTQTKIGSGRVELSVADPLTGAITLNAGELALVSAASTDGTTNGNLTLNPGSRLSLDNTVTSVENRLGGNTKTLALGGATFRFTGNGATSEALGALTVNAGSSVIDTSGGMLSFTSLAVRNAGGVVNIASVDGSSIQFTTAAPALTPAGTGILSGFFVGNDFATCGDIGVPVTAYASYVTGDLAAAGATDTVMPTGPQSGVDNLTINALNLTAGTGATIHLYQTLTLGAGGLINNGGGSISGGSLSTTDNAELIANYVTHGSIGSVISGTTGGLTKTGAGTLTLVSRMTYTGRTTVNQGTLTLAAGNHTLAVSQPLMVNQGGTLDLGDNSQYLGNLSSAGAVEDSGGIVTGTGGTLTLNQTTDAIFAGSIQGSVNLVKTGLRTLTLTSANPTTGSISIIGGLGSVRERNNTGDLGFGITLRDGGTLPATSAITVRNSTLNLDNTGTKDIADRVSDTAPITLDNGTIRYVGRLQTNSAETLGPVTASGFSAITMLVAGNANTQTGQHSATLTLTSLTRNPGAIIHFNRSGGVHTPLGQLGNRPRILLAGDDTSGLTLCNDTVVGMYTNNDNDKMMPVSYVPGLGFGNMGQAGFPNHYMAGADGNGFTGTNTLASALPTNDFNTGASQLVKLGGQTVNSLGIQGNATTLLNFQDSDDTLTLQSGWLALWFSRNTLGSTTTRGAITSGQSELFLFGDHLAALFPNNANTIHSVIKDNGTNSVKFVMGLARDTYLTADNTYTGGTVVSDLVARENGGTGYFGGVLATLYLNGTVPGALTIPNAATPADGLVINSSNVTMQTNEGQIGADNIVTLNGSSVLTLVGNNSLAGLVFNSNGGTLTPTVNPGGTLTLTGDLGSTLTNAAVSPLVNGGILDFAGATRNVTVTALPEGDYAGYAGLRITSAIQNGGLTKVGAGILTLSGNNVFTGDTTIKAGTLKLDGSGSIDSSPNILVGDAGSTGAVLDVTTKSGGFTVGGSQTLSGIGTILGAVNVTGVLAPGASVATLASGALSFSDLSNFAYEVDSSAAATVGADLMKVTGNLDLAGTVSLTFSDIAVSDTAFTTGTIFSLLNFSGTWNGGKFSFGGNELDDNEQFSAGLNVWEIDYDALTGGLNYSGEYAGGADSFVNLTAISGASMTPYQTWASGFSSPALSNQAADADPDEDGLDNGVEYVLGTDPRFTNQGGPTGSVVGTDLKFTFNRKDSSETVDLALLVQVSTNLTDWTTIPGYSIGATTGASSAGVNVNEAGPVSTDIITVTIPKGSDTKKFARLRVIVTP